MYFCVYICVYSQGWFGSVRTGLVNICGYGVIQCVLLSGRPRLTEPLSAVYGCVEGEKSVSV